MKRLGYIRNLKRCKEMWANINKNYKKMKESNKKRHDGSETCPYFMSSMLFIKRKYGPFNLGLATKS